MKSQQNFWNKLEDFFQHHEDYIERVLTKIALLDVIILIGTGILSAAGLLILLILMMEEGAEVWTSPQATIYYKVCVLPCIITAVLFVLLPSADPY